MSNSRKTSVICIANQKGGVAKTTTVVNLAAAFSSLGKQVLVIDSDYQGNASDTLGINMNDTDKKNLALGIKKELSGERIVLKSNVPNIDVIAGTRDLTDVVSTMTGQVHQHLLLKHIISEKILEKYDIILIDTHPTLDCLYMSAMAISNYYLIPVFPDPESAKGILEMVHSAEKIRKYLNPLLYNLGIVICRYDKSFSAHNKFVERIKNIAKTAHFPICKNIIPNSASIPSASIATQPVVAWKPNAAISITYCALAGELLPHLKGKRLGKVPQLNMSEVSRLKNELEISTEF